MIKNAILFLKFQAILCAQTYSSKEDVTVVRYLRIALISLSLLNLASYSFAQTLSHVQTIVPNPPGEGRPGQLFGYKVAVDGDLAIIGERPAGANGQPLNHTRLRVYRKSSGVWNRANDLTLESDFGLLMDLAFSGDRVVFSMLNSVSQKWTVVIYMLVNDRWVWESELVPPSSFALGYSVAIHGNRVVVGDPTYDSERGLIRVFTRDNNGAWSWKNLQASPQRVGSRFGSSVGIWAGAIVVGAPNQNFGISPLKTDAGAIYVFELTMTTWNQINVFYATTPETNAHFGKTVAISGLDPSIPDRILAAAPDELSQTGAVYGFNRGVSMWEPQFRLSDAQQGQVFGNSVSLDGAYAAIGAYAYDISAELLGAGAVYGVTFNAGFTAATQVQRKTAPKPKLGQKSGFSLALDRTGPTTFVGNVFKEVYGNVDQGEILLSAGVPGTPFPSLVSVFDLGNGATDAEFGSISAEGEDLIVGAPNEDAGVIENVGAVYFFRRQANGQFVQTQHIASPDGATGDRFGAAVAIYGDTALVGAPKYDKIYTDAGAVYVYRRISGVWQLESQLFNGCSEYDRQEFGRSLALRGSAAIIGSICNDESGRALEGEIATRRSNGTWLRQRFGISLRMRRGAWAGDLALIGTPKDDNHPSPYDWGSLQTFHKTEQNNYDWYNARPNLEGQYFGQGFGFDVSAEQGLMAVSSADNNVPVRLYRLSPSQWLPDGTLIADAGNVGSLHSVAVRNNRVAVGVPDYAGDTSEEGAVFVYGQVNGVWTQQQKLRAPVIENSARFSDEMLMLADGTLLVAAKFEDGGFVNQGVVHVFSPPVDLMFKNGFEDTNP
jgi:hypothetical protein